MCLWVELPPEIDALKLYQQALSAKISIAPGPLFSAKQNYQNFIRLNTGNPWSEAVENAVRKLGDIMRSGCVSTDEAQAHNGKSSLPLKNGSKRLNSSLPHQPSLVGSMS
jgi:hypothetical protein